MSIQVKKSKSGWHLLLWENSKAVYIKQSEWPRAFHTNLTYQEAQKTAKSLRAEKEIRVRKRVTQDKAVQSAFLPTEAVETFLSVWYSGKEGKVKANAVSQWRAAEKAIAAIKINPSDWLLNPKAVYSYFEKLKVSPNWAVKVIHTMNVYGHIYCRQRSYPFSRLEYPKDTSNWKYDREKSSKLTLEQLQELKKSLTEPVFNWFFVCFWFGLRPGEMKLWGDKTSCWVEEVDNVKVLVMDQPKLKMIKKDKRAKKIPVLLPEQREALVVGLSGNFKTPGRGSKKHLPDGVTAYGCRHGFASLMGALGHDIDTIQSWLGHRHRSTTETYYEDHGIVKGIKPK